MYERAAKIEPPVDLYSFGVTAWLMLMGAYPDCVKRVPPRGHEQKLADLTVRLPKDALEAIDRCLSADSATRPGSAELRDTLGRSLLHGRHRGILCSEQRTYELDKPGATIRVTMGTLGEMSISYDGDAFLATLKAGDIFVNNARLGKSVQLPGACVITFGVKGKRREFVTFDISHPEVIL